MAREIDEKKKRKALRKLRKAAERAEADNGPGLSDWEREFVEEVEMRVEKYGSAFADPDKGSLDEPLSALQTRKLKEIDKKSRGKAKTFKPRSGFSKSKKKQAFTPRSRDINDDIEAPDLPETPPPARPASDAPKRKLKLVVTPNAPRPTAAAQDKAVSETPPDKANPFRVIKGGRDI